MIERTPEDVARFESDMKRIHARLTRQHIPRCKNDDGRAVYEDGMCYVCYQRRTEHFACRDAEQKR